MENKLKLSQFLEETSINNLDLIEISKESSGNYISKKIKYENFISPMSDYVDQKVSEIELIPGQKGDQGAQGEQGIQGGQGDQGETGDEGPTSLLPQEIKGFSFITTTSGAMFIALSLCDDSSVAKNGNVKIDWGDGSAVQTFTTTGSPNLYTCTKTASYTQANYKTVRVWCEDSNTNIYKIDVYATNLTGCLDLRGSTKLIEVDCRNNSRLQTIIGGDNVEYLNANNCYSITSINDMSSVKILYMYNCKSILTIPTMSNIQELRCSYCDSLTSIGVNGEIAGGENLEYVDCRNCPLLSYLPAWSGVFYINCSSCTSLTSLPDWENVDAVDCYTCTSLTSLPSWPNVTYVDYSECTSLTSFPSWPNVTDVYCNYCNFSESQLNEIYTNLPDWSPVGGKSGIIRSSPNPGYPANTTIATSKDWTVS